MGASSQGCQQASGGETRVPRAQGNTVGPCPPLPCEEGAAWGWACSLRALGPGTHVKPDFLKDCSFLPKRGCWG